MTGVNSFTVALKASDWSVDGYFYVNENPTPAFSMWFLESGAVHFASPCCAADWSHNPQKKIQEHEATCGDFQDFCGEPKPWPTGSSEKRYRCMGHDKPVEEFTCVKCGKGSPICFQLPGEQVPTGDQFHRQLESYLSDVVDPLYCYVAVEPLTTLITTVQEWLSKNIWNMHASTVQEERECWKIVAGKVSTVDSFQVAV